MSDRGQTSILTNRLLEYLEGNNDPGNPREYDRRIRERLNLGMIDLYLLFDLLGDDELQKVFGPHYAEPIKEHEKLRDNKQEIPPARACMPGVVAFLVQAMDIDDLPLYPPFDEPQPAFSEFTTAVERGIKKYLSEKKDILADVEVTIELKNVDRAENLFEETEK